MARLHRALGELIIDGSNTTIPAHFNALLDAPEVQSGDYTIHWLEGMDLPKTLGLSSAARARRSYPGLVPRPAPIGRRRCSIWVADLGPPAPLLAVFQQELSRIAP